MSRIVANDRLDLASAFSVAQGVRRLSYIAAAVFVLPLLGACAPSYPLFTPIDVAKAHGYSEQRLDTDRYLVSFRVPSRVTMGVTRVQREADAQKRLDLGYDMALWRAAELTLANGFPAFSVGDRTNSVQFSPQYVDWSGRAYPYPPYYYGGPYDPFFADYPNYYPTYWYIDATVTLKVAFEREIKPGFFDAKDAIAKLRAQYPNALATGQPLS